MITSCHSVVAVQQQVDSHTTQHNTKQFHPIIPRKSPSYDIPLREKVDYIERRRRIGGLHTTQSTASYTTTNRMEPVQSFSNRT
jgi:hypothetical protein